MKISRVVFTLLFISTYVRASSDEDRFNKIEELIVSGEYETYNPTSLHKLLAKYTKPKETYICREILLNYFTKPNTKGCGFGFENETIQEYPELNRILDLAIKYNAKSIVKYIYTVRKPAEIHRKGSNWPYNAFAQSLDYPTEYYIRKINLPEGFEMLNNNLDNHKDPLGMTKELLKGYPHGLKPKFFRDHCVNSSQNDAKHINICKYMNQSLIDLANNEE